MSESKACTVSGREASRGIGLTAARRYAAYGDGMAGSLRIVSPCERYSMRQ